jgi:hypothetical protein
LLKTKGLALLEAKNKLVFERKQTQIKLKKVAKNASLCGIEPAL